MEAILMMPQIAWINREVVRLTPLAAGLAVCTLVSAIWEGAVLVACVALCLRLFRGLSAAARSVVWVNVFALLVLLQVMPYVGPGSAAASTSRPAQLELSLSWCYAVAGIWLLLSFFRGAQLVFGAIRLQRLAGRATPLQAGEDRPGEDLRPLLQVRIMGGRVGRSAELCTSTEVQRPSVFGFLHPRILIPPALLSRLTASELRQVVIHEMEHLRRGDDWINLLQKIAVVVFPLNPALLWVERRLCVERELACDDTVMHSSCGRKAYAICLTHLAEYSMLRRGLSLALGAWERQSELVRRVHRILRRPSRAMSRRQTVVMTSGLTAAVVGCAIVLAHSPQLVGFATAGQNKTQAQPQGQAYASLPIRNIGAPVQSFGATTHMQLAKAIMEQPSTSSQRTLQSFGQESSQARGESIRSTPAAASIRRDVIMHRAKKPDAARRQQAWIVMTQWNAEGNSQRLVWAVLGDSRASYAAVRTPHGWLIIQI
ncbi:MAG: M56 family metallopeptidase [Terracidiphilus sp.]